MTFKTPFAEASHSEAHSTQHTVLTDQSRPSSLGRNSLPILFTEANHLVLERSVLKIFLMWILFCYSSESVSQIPQNFYEFQNYYHDPIRFVSTGVDDEGGSNAYMDRLNKVWGERLYPHGDVGVASAAYLDYVEKFFNGEYVTYPVDWNFEGPVTANADQKPWAGRMNRIAFDPFYGQVYNGNEIWTIYSCSGLGGLWRSDDSGENWYNLNTDTQLPMCSAADITVSKQNRNILYLATGQPDDALPAILSQSLYGINPIYTTGVYKSIDGGITWQQANGNLLESFEDGGTIRRILVDPSNDNIVWIATSKGVWKTENAQANNEEVIWNLLIEDGFPLNIQNNYRGLEFHPSNSNTVYTSGDAVWKSTNGGSSFTNISGSLTGWELMGFIEPTFQLTQINIAVTQATEAHNWIYAYVIGSIEQICNGNDTRKPKAFICIYDGSIWHQVHAFEPPLINCNYGTYDYITNFISPTWQAISVHPSNPDKIVFGYTKVLGSVDPDATISTIVTPNSNVTFVEMGSYDIQYQNHADCHDLKFEPQATLIPDPDLWQAHDGGISVKQTDWNSSGGWSRKLKGIDAMTIWSFDDSDKEKATFITSNQDNGVSRINPSVGAPEWKTAFIGDGYGSQVSDQYDRYFYMGNGTVRSNNLAYSDEIYEGLSGSGLGGLGTYPSPLDSQDPNNKADIAQTFKVKEKFKTGETFVGWSEIYKRKKAKKDATTINSNPSDLWELASDIGENDDIAWKGYRQITEFEIAEDDPNVVYVVTRGFLENGTIWTGEAGALHSHFLACTQWDQLNNNSEITFQDLSGALPFYDANGDETQALPTGIAINPANAAEVWLSFTGFCHYVKVYRSLDHGQSFQNMDPNETLPNIPINGIVYQPGTNGRVFIATDAGVWMRDEGTEDWVKYGNIPNVRVTEIKINRCANEVRVCTFGRGLWSAPLPPSTATENFMVLTSSSPIIWADHHYNNINIEISAGTELRITGTLTMPINGKIRVRPNAKLVVDGGTITNACGSLWQGIEVLGNHQQPQTAANQGTVEMKNGATIANARFGIRTILSDGQGNLDWAKTGGIIKVKDSHFINNRKAIEFMAFHNMLNGGEIANVSYIKNCDFETNEEHHFDVNEHLSFVTLWDVNGVRINGNRFQNTLAPTLNYPLDRGSGIISAMATYSVTDHCTNTMLDCTGGTLIRNEFSGLKYAIRGSGPASFNSLTIDHAKFTNNYRAVYLSGFGNPTITRNEFDWAVLSPSSTYGLYLNNCTGYEVEENTFNGYDMQNATGAIIRNSGEGDNLIYKNTFGNLNAATTISGVNDEIDEPNFTGLQIWCNDYRFENDVDSDNNYDIFLGANASIADYQGDAENNKPAGNRFWAPMEMGDMSEVNLTTNAPVSSFEYITHDPTMSPETYPTDHSSEVGILVSNGDSYGPTSCPSNLSKGKVKSIVKSQMVNNHTTHAQLKTVYNAYINNGEGVDLAALIADPAISEVAVRSALMAASPKVSDQLMLDAMHRTPALTGWHMAQVLVANSPLRTTVIQEMKRMGYQPFYEQLVENTQNGTVNTKNMMEMDFAWYGASKGQEQADLKRLVIAEDETTDRWTELTTIKGEQPYFMSDAEMMAYYYDKGDLASANTIAQNADPNYDQIALIATSSALRTDGLNATGLTASQVLMLENIAYSEKLSACTAAGILEFWNIAPYDEPIEEPIGQLRSFKIKTEVTELDWISILPNPTNDLCHLIFMLPEGCEKALMQIIDPMGRTIESKDITATGGLVEYDTKTLASGLYNVQLTVDGIDFGTASMMVQH